jgi:two-component sensor histidine kinase
VHVTLIPGNVSLAADRCWRVALIVAELVNNAARHAFCDGGGWVLVEVDVDVDGPAICCRVSDDGRPAAAPLPGLGRSIAESLAQALGGTIQWRFEQAGTSTVLRIPADPPVLD